MFLIAIHILQRLIAALVNVGLQQFKGFSEQRIILTCQQVVVAGYEEATGRLVEVQLVHQTIYPVEREVGNQYSYGLARRVVDRNAVCGHHRLGTVLVHIRGRPVASTFLNGSVEDLGF